MEQHNKTRWECLEKNVTSLRNICKETKLKEFQFKLIHRIVVTKKELHRCGIKADDEYLYCGKKDSIEEKLFGIISGPYEKEILKKFNYTILFMKYFIYTSKMENQAIYLSVFVNKVLFKYRIENFSH